MSLTHEDLVSELPKLEKLNASERKKLNDNRRCSQIDSWSTNEGSPDGSERHPQKRKKQARPHFDVGVVLLNCTSLGDVEGVEELLKQGVSPTCYNVDRITPLHQSCLENDCEITELLIEAGCEIDSTDNELWTPLHAAVSLANLECVQMLLKYSANQLSPNVDGQLPIDLCDDPAVRVILEMDLEQKGITSEDMDVARTSQELVFFNEVKRLLEDGGNPDFQNLDNDATLLHVAAANGYVEVALYLLSKSCKVDLQDIDGWTPLHAAAFWGEVDIIELLAAHGAQFKIRTFSGELPSDLTEEDDIKHLIQRLTERSEMMKKHAGVNFRPSSVRGRLVSRMTSGEREDKRRESAELHNVFVEQIEQDIAKAPDSWRVRTGKYVRPSLREANFEHSLPEAPRPTAGATETSLESNGKNSPSPGSDQPKMTDVLDSQRPSLERSASFSDTDNSSYHGDPTSPPAEPAELSAIRENGTGATNTENIALQEIKPDLAAGECVSSKRVFTHVSTDDTTFELISPSTDTLDSEAVWNSSTQPSQRNYTPDKDLCGDTVVCENKAITTPPSPRTSSTPPCTIRKEKSFDDLVNTKESDFRGADKTDSHMILSRSTSLSHCKPRPVHGNVRRIKSLKSGEMDEAAPRFSPKPNTNKSSKNAYKNRKKANSSVSASKHSSVDDETLTNSIPSGEEHNLVTMPTSPGVKEIEETEMFTPAPESSSGAHSNSMATNAGSLSGPAMEPPVTTTKDSEKRSKSKKCCIIL